MIARGICREPDKALVCWIAIQLCPGGQSLLEEFMLIRFGYDITVHCEASTPMVCLMDVRPEYDEHMVSEEQVVTTPHVPTHTYVDMFGNVCRRFTALQRDLGIILLDENPVGPAQPDKRHREKGQKENPGNRGTDVKL